jgi:hypothetical protein
MTGISVRKITWDTGAWRARSTRHRAVERAAANRASQRFQGLRDERIRLVLELGGRKSIAIF